MKTLFVAAALALTALSATADEAIELPGGDYMIAYQDDAGVVCHIEEGCQFWSDLSVVHQTKVVEIIATRFYCLSPHVRKILPHMGGLPENAVRRLESTL
jgi:hypothetical protein